MMSNRKPSHVSLVDHLDILELYLRKKKKTKKANYL
jgi:hypothetical protein